jgi:hypothetical protein
MSSGEIVSAPLFPLRSIQCSNRREVDSPDAFGPLGELAELERMDRVDKEIATLADDDAKEAARLGEEDRRRRWAEARQRHLPRMACDPSGSQPRQNAAQTPSFSIGSRLRRQLTKLTIRPRRVAAADEEVALGRVRR